MTTVLVIDDDRLLRRTGRCLLIATSGNGEVAAIAVICRSAIGPPGPILSRS